MIKTFTIMIIAIAMVSITIGQIDSVNAHPHNSSTTYISLGDSMAIERTALAINVPADNLRPWAFVEGKVTNPVEGYPIIIQIHELGGEPVRLGQVELAQDNTYEYKFRISSQENGNIVHVFDGDYEIIVYKVVHADQDTLPI